MFGLLERFKNKTVNVPNVVAGERYYLKHKYQVETEAIDIVAVSDCKRILVVKETTGFEHTYIRFAETLWENAVAHTVNGLVETITIPKLNMGKIIKLDDLVIGKWYVAEGRRHNFHSTMKTPILVRINKRDGNITYVEHCAATYSEHKINVNVTTCVDRAEKQYVGSSYEELFHPVTPLGDIESFTLLT